MTDYKKDRIEERKSSSKIPIKKVPKGIQKNADSGAPSVLLLWTFRTTPLKGNYSIVREHRYMVLRDISKSLIYIGSIHTQSWTLWERAIMKWSGTPLDSAPELLNNFTLRAWIMWSATSTSIKVKQQLLDSIKGLQGRKGIIFVFRRILERIN